MILGLGELELRCCSTLGFWIWICGEGVVLVFDDGSRVRDDWGWCLGSLGFQVAKVCMRNMRWNLIRETNSRESQPPRELG